MNPLSYLNYVVVNTVAAQLALIALVSYTTWAVTEWFWTKNRPDPQSQAHFSQARWGSRLKWILGIAFFAVLYLFLLLK